MIRVAVTGTTWMGSGIGSIESAIDELFRAASNEMMLSVYTIGTGADLVFRWLEGALARGVQVSLIINALGNQPPDVVKRLAQIEDNYRHFYLYDFQGEIGSSLHAKAIVADHRVALVGSSNMSRRGLLANHELALLVDGPAAAAAGRAMDALLKSPLVRRVEHRRDGVGPAGA